MRVAHLLAQSRVCPQVPCPGLDLALPMSDAQSHMLTSIHTQTHTHWGRPSTLTSSVPEDCWPSEAGTEDLPESGSQTMLPGNGGVTLAQQDGIEQHELCRTLSNSGLVTVLSCLCMPASPWALNLGLELPRAVAEL